MYNIYAMHLITHSLVALALFPFLISNIDAQFLSFANDEDPQIVYRLRNLGVMSLADLHAAFKPITATSFESMGLSVTGYIPDGVKSGDAGVFGIVLGGVVGAGSFKFAKNTPGVIGALATAMVATGTYVDARVVDLENEFKAIQTGLNDDEHFCDPSIETDFSEVEVACGEVVGKSVALAISSKSNFPKHKFVIVYVGVKGASGSVPVTAEQVSDAFHAAMNVLAAIEVKASVKVHTLRLESPAKYIGAPTDADAFAMAAISGLANFVKGSGTLPVKVEFMSPDFDSAVTKVFTTTVAPNPKPAPNPNPGPNPAPGPAPNPQSSAGRVRMVSSVATAIYAVGFFIALVR